MAYLINDGYTLEGFTNKPFCLVNDKERYFRKLSKEEFNLLARCDGSQKSDILDENQAHLAHHFVHRGVLSQVDAMSSDGHVPVLEYEFNEFLHFNATQIAITGRCNLRCRHCLAAADGANVATQLTLEECKKIFADMVEARIFNLWLTGGEPLIHPQFKQIVRTASEYGLRLERLFTNGSLIDSEVLDFLEELGRRPQFVISFDGLGTHDWMRNSVGAEERTLAAIDLVLSRGFEVCVGVNVNGVTAPVVIETCRSLVFDHGVRKIHPIFTSPTPRWAQFAGEKELLDIEQYYDLMIDLLRASRVEKWPASLDVIHFPHVHLYPDMKAAQYLREPPAPRFDRRIISSCGRANNVAFIASDGRVLPCSTYEGETTARNIMMGNDINVKTRPLKDILGNSEFADQHRITIADLAENNPECPGCKWVQICCGGCPLYTMERKIWDCGNPLCKLYKGGYATKYLDMLEETAGIL